MKYTILALVLASVTLTTGCEGGFSDPHLSTSTLSSGAGYSDNALARETYRATDRVLKQAASVTSDVPMLVGTIEDIDYLETSTTFGRVLAEQISTRLTQHGYNITELKLRNSLNIKQGYIDPKESGEYILSRDVDSLKGQHKAAIIMTGTYAIAGEEVMVNLKLLDVATGRVLGATDYSVDIDANTRQLISSSSNQGYRFYGRSMAYNN